MATKKICVKCQQVVPMGNDAWLIRKLAGLDELVILERRITRHLIATPDCPGSPHTAQYIEGQPKDKRGYGYFADIEKCIRKGYEKAQQLQREAEKKEGESDEQQH